MVDCSLERQLKEPMAGHWVDHVMRLNEIHLAGQSPIEMLIQRIQFSDLCIVNLEHIEVEYIA